MIVNQNFLNPKYDLERFHYTGAIAQEEHLGTLEMLIRFPGKRNLIKQAWKDLRDEPSFPKTPHYWLTLNYLRILKQGKRIQKQKEI